MIGLGRTRWLVILFVLTGCSSSIYSWQAGTNSTPTAPSFAPIMILTEEDSAVFLAMMPAPIKGNEVPLGHYLHRVLKKGGSKCKGGFTASGCDAGESGRVGLDLCPAPV